MCQNDTTENKPEEQKNDSLRECLCCIKWLVAFFVFAICALMFCIVFCSIEDCKNVCALIVCAAILVTLLICVTVIAVGCINKKAEKDSKKGQQDTSEMLLKAYKDIFGQGKKEEVRKDK